MSGDIDFAKLAAGNKIAKTWSVAILGRRKFSKFLSVLFNPARAKEFNITDEQLAKIQEIPADDLKAIKAVKSLSDAIAFKYEKMTFRIASRLGKIAGASRDDISQIQSEAMLGLLRAIRSYDDLSIKFITYAYKTVYNECSRYMHDNSSLGLRINQSLRAKYNRTKRDLEKNGPASFDQVADKMKLSPKVRTRLSLSLNSAVCRESEMEETLGKILLDKRKDTRVDTELLAKLQGKTLTALELDSFMVKSEVKELFPQSLKSMLAVAEKYDVTPQAVSVAAERAQRKLAAAIRTDWGDDISGS